MAEDEDGYGVVGWITEHLEDVVYKVFLEEAKCEENPRGNRNRENYSE